MDGGLWREASVELALEQAANVLWAKGTKADVPDFRIHVVTDMRFVRFVGPRPNHDLTVSSQSVRYLATVIPECGIGTPRSCSVFAAASSLATSSRIAAK
jgi:hypothetical protein